MAENSRRQQTLTDFEVRRRLHFSGNSFHPPLCNIVLTVVQAFWAGVWVYNLALTMTKIAILVQYLRIFPLKCFRKACFSVLGFVVAWGAWTILSSILICTPVAFSWDKSVPNGRCMNQLILWVVNAGVNIIQDVVIFLLPLFVVRTLQIAKAQKKALFAMFGLGAWYVKNAYHRRGNGLTCL